MVIEVPRCMTTKQVKGLWGGFLRKNKSHEYSVMICQFSILSHFLIMLDILRWSFSILGTHTKMQG